MTPIKVGELAELVEACRAVYVNGSRMKWMPELTIEAELERLMKAFTKISWKVEEMQNIPAKIEEAA